MNDAETGANTLAAGESCQVLVLRAGGTEICIELGIVERTFSLVDLQAMPGGAPYMAGIMDLAGHSVPVIDLALRLDLPSAPYTLDTPIVVCLYAQRRIGVIVQDIIGIQTLQSQDRQLAHELGGAGAAFRASAHTGQGLAWLLDSTWLTSFGFYQDAADGIDALAAM